MTKLDVFAKYKDFLGRFVKVKKSYSEEFTYAYVDNEFSTFSNNTEGYDVWHITPSDKISCKNALTAGSINDGRMIMRLMTKDEKFELIENLKNKTYYSSSNSGIIKITRSDLAYGISIYSGTFHCTLYNKDNPSETIQIIDGRFDFNSLTLHN